MPKLIFNLLNSCLIGLIALTTLPPSLAFAQNTGIEVTSVFDLADKDTQDGDIVIITAAGITRANVPSDARIFGVIQLKPLLTYRNVDGSGTPVVRQGIVKVNVTTLAGDIKKGDFITSSLIAGKGQKATSSGYVIGVALEDLDKNAQSSSFQSKSIRQGQIKLAIRIEYAEINTVRSVNRLLEYFDAALFTNLQNPERFIQFSRYVAAAIVLLIAFLVGYLTFAKAIANGIQAIGRNPLAKQSIQLSIILNLVLAVITALIGLIAAFILVRI